MKELGEHQNSKGQESQTFERVGQTFIITSQASKACHPAETTLYHPTSRQQDKALLGRWQLDDNQVNTVRGSGLLWLIPGIALVNKSDLYMFTSDLLNGLCQLSNLSAVTFIGGGNMQSQQVSKGVYCHVHLAALTSLGSIVARSRSAFWAALQGSTVKDTCRRLLTAAFRHAQQFTQIMHHLLKNTGFEPALRLLIDGGPRWQVIRHHPPLRSRPNNPAQAVEHFSQFIVSLWRIFSHQTQVWRDKSPLFINSHHLDMLFCSSPNFNKSS